MEISYKLSIPNPESHYICVTMDIKNISDKNLDLFIPSWSPGSYLMREYAKNVKFVHVENSKGQRLFVDKISKETWRVNTQIDNHLFDHIIVKYQIYCHELTVRTSHVDLSHAFIHGPSVFMSAIGAKGKIVLEIEMNPNWSKVTTTLKDISTKREVFLYEARDYDTFIDTPIEIGNHETDGFMYDGKPHELATYGGFLGDQTRYKKDIKKIVEHIARTVGELPYERYLFLSHFCPKLYGGLEHLDSTVLQYDSYKMNDKKDYYGWLELVAHEYFHLWNVKRIRPKELGPFDYRNEAYTRMHWLTEGLTSFMDQLFIFRADFITLEEYLELIKDNINKYLSIPGRKYHSLEDSSFDTWIKLYRADENHNNTSISYYLKGGLVFFVFNIMLTKFDISIVEFIRELWSLYKKDPSVGLEEEDVFNLITKLTNKDCSEEFEHLVKSVEDIDFGTYLKEVGVEIEYEKEKLDLGFDVSFKGERVFVKSVREDSAAYKYGISAGDEIISLNGFRFLKDDYQSLDKILNENTVYKFVVSRLGYMTPLKIMPAKGIKKIKMLKVLDTDLAHTKLRGTKV